MAGSNPSLATMTRDEAVVVLTDIRRSILSEGGGQAVYEVDFTDVDDIRALIEASDEMYEWRSKATYIDPATFEIQSVLFTPEKSRINLNLLPSETVE
jgi:hypothetical protein